MAGLYGRGAADMKSGLAAAIFAIRALQEAGPFPGRIAVCALADEEELMLGAKHLAASGLLAGAARAIICEPEGGEICTVAQGAIRLRADLHGTMAHGAMPHLGRNPVAAAGPLLAAAGRLQAELRPSTALPATWTPSHYPDRDGGRRFPAGQRYSRACRRVSRYPDHSDR